MQMFRLTSRSINKDPLYQSEQEKLQDIHLHKLRMITSTQLKPLKSDSTIKIRFRKAKSMAKVFEKDESIINQRFENHSLLKKLVNAESTLKPLRIKQAQLNEKLYGTASNWTQRKKEEQTVKRQNQLMAKKCENITNVDLKDIKKKMQDEIKEYLELRDSIRKMHPAKTSELNKRQKTSYGNKITIYQSTNTDPNVEGGKNPQQHSQSSNQSTKENIEIVNDNKIQFLKRQDPNMDESPKKDPFAEVKRLRQLKKISQENQELRNLQKKEKSVKKLYVGPDKLVRKVQNFINLI